jgi:putative addiction module component (TIGR02574 family)
MSTQIAELHKSIQLLSQTDRAELAYHILSTLEEEETGAEEAWQAEIQQRVADYRGGKAQFMSEDELFARLNGRSS